MEKIAEILKIIEKIVQETLGKFPTCRIGLAGGQTPKKLYEALAKKKFPWGKIEFIQIDERYVPPEDKNSNFHMQNEALFKKISAKEIIVFDTTLPWKESAKKMTEKLQKLQNEREPLFDILILGMGADGHIASLFPHSKALESAELATPSETKNFTASRRLTLTYRALLNSRKIFLLIQGEEKKKIIEKIRKKGVDDNFFYKTMPITKILQEKSVCIVFIKEHIIY